MFDAGKDDIIGVDLDGCREPDAGKMAAWAARIIANMRQLCRGVTHQKPA